MKLQYKKILCALTLSSLTPLVLNAQNIDSKGFSYTITVDENHPLIIGQTVGNFLGSNQVLSNKTFILTLDEKDAELI